MTRIVTTGKRIVKEAIADNITGEAAKVAYYMFLSLFPLILVVFALTGIVGGGAAFDVITGWLRTAMPGGAAAYLRRFVAEITLRSHPGLLSIGLVLTLWSASNIFAALTDGLDIMYDVTRKRGWWKKRLIAIGLLIIDSILAIGAAALLLLGPALADALGLSGVWLVVRWPAAYVLLVGFTWLIYYILPNTDQSRYKLRVLAGAAIGAALWVAATALFRLYVSNFGNYDRSYGVLGGVIILLLWMYLTAVTVLLGGEVAATLQPGKPRAAAAEQRKAA